MFRTVSLPVWLLVLILGFAAVTFASHFLFPSVRWFFRRRMEKAVARLNTRLSRPIEPFKLARRHDTLQRLIYDTEVIAAVNDHARAEAVPQSVAHEEARRYAREIVPAFSASAYFGFGTRAARWLSEMLYHVRIAQMDERVAAIDPAATVVYVINHRSNMDYVLVTYLAADRTSLSYAVGEWARVWPLSALIRSMGAFFIRRKSRNFLYRRVLARYVQIATAEGVTQAVFPEGGLSLDGRIGAPKLGILSYILGAETGGRDVVFVPVALNYDRILEDRALVAAGQSGQRRFGVPLGPALGYALRRLWRKVRGRFRRYGHAAVSFGAPLSLAALRAGRPSGGPEALGLELMRRIAVLVPVLPVPLLARVILERGPIERPSLESAFDDAAGRMRAAGALVVACDGAALPALDLLLRRRLAEDRDGAIQAAPGAAPLLAFYAASIDHLAPSYSAGARS